MCFDIERLIYTVYQIGAWMMHDTMDCGQKIYNSVQCFTLWFYLVLYWEPTAWLEIVERFNKKKGENKEKKKIEPNVLRCDTWEHWPICDYFMILIGKLGRNNVILWIIAILRI